jgi:hypothetical protein
LLEDKLLIGKVGVFIYKDCSSPETVILLKSTVIQHMSVAKFVACDSWVIESPRSRNNEASVSF